MPRLGGRAFGRGRQLDYMAVRPRDEKITSDRLLDAFLAASVAVVLVGWFAALSYLGFRFL